MSTLTVIAVLVLAALVIAIGVAIARSGELADVLLANQFVQGMFRAIVMILRLVIPCQ